MLQSSWRLPSSWTEKDFKLPPPVLASLLLQYRIFFPVSKVIQEGLGLAAVVDEITLRASRGGRPSENSSVLIVPS